MDGCRFTTREEAGESSVSLDLELFSMAKAESLSAEAKVWTKPIPWILEVSKTPSTHSCLWLCLLHTTRLQPYDVGFDTKGQPV